jgi:RNA polymerase sigma factor (sigma-70 family)
MATSPMSAVIQHLRTAVLLRDGAGLTDGQLLKDYLSRGDEAALAALVGRHGPMVWGVCRRVLRNWHDAEDAFQATFLVFVRKATSIASPELLANWLYGVAHQTALKARATTAKRRARERQVTEMAEPAATELNLWQDLQPLLDQELSRLPDIYRVAIVLCDLEGKTRKEAARQLGVPEGTLAARLARGRVMLAKRLARHGLAVSGGSLAALLAQNAASASAPTSVVVSTIKAASLLAAGQAAATGLISAKAAALTDGVLKAMLMTKLKIATAVLLVVAVLGLGGSSLFDRSVAAAQEPSKSAAKDPQPAKVPPDVPKKVGNPDYDELVGIVIGVIDDTRFGVKIDEKRLGRLLNSGERITGVQLDDITVAKETKVFIDGKEGKLADLQKHMRVSVELKPNTNLAVQVRASWPKIRGKIAFVKAKEITLVAELTKVYPTENQVQLRLETAYFDKDLKVLIDGKAGKLTDLKKGMPAILYLRADTEDVIRIEAKKIADK